MANVGNFNTQRMHTQLHGKANFNELTKREDVLLNRKINVSLGLFSGFLLIITILIFRFEGINEFMTWTGVLGGILLVILLIRLGFVKPKRKNSRSNEIKKGSWKEISSLPNWAHKKMRRRKTNKVNGENYVYLRKGSKFYKRKK